MNRTVYDLSMLAALGLCSAGAGLQWGVPVALLVAGGLLAAFTVLGVILSGGR